MSALKIAFDVMIVGALALPWVLLIIHLYFPEAETHLAAALSWINKKLEGFSALWPVAAVVLFALAYTLGSAVSRVAEDFFNDDDLYFPAFRHTFRNPITEDRILTNVYCESGTRQLLPDDEGNSALAKEVGAFQAHQSSLCFLTMAWNPKRRCGDLACTECPEGCIGEDDPWCLERPGAKTTSSRLRQTFSGFRKMHSWTPEATTRHGSASFTIKSWCYAARRSTA
jgi:hypothetical protein